MFCLRQFASQSIVFPELPRLNGWNVAWRWDELSNREKLIAAMVTADGKSDKEVAAAYNLTEHWVANIIRVIHIKLQTQCGRGSRVKLAFLVGQHWHEVEAEIEGLKKLTKGTEV